MEYRRLGRTAHKSSVILFGGYGLGQTDQVSAEAALDTALRYGVNHIDIAPSYPDSEVRLRPWLARHRHEVFLGCKTLERRKEGAARELLTSLERMGVDSFDLYQLHSVGTLEALNEATAPGGALEALIEAREEGLIRHIGLTGHGLDAPVVQLEALARFPFDTLMFPLNHWLYAIPPYRENATRLLEVARQQDAGVQIIKAVAKGPWGEVERRYATWYEPHDTPEMITTCARFVLSQPVTALATPGDVRLLAAVLDAASGFTPMSPREQEAFIEAGAQAVSIFA